jgi:signal transduction histidine kinase
LEITEVPITNTVNNLKILLQEALKEKSIKLINEIPESVTIPVDQAFFKNALHNLLSNAIKFSHENSEITISAITNETGTTIKVKDNGLGIPERFKESLFKFNKKHSSKGTKGEQGAGIGLSVVKRIVDLHNGDIKVNSTEGHGTTIGISIPHKEI